jgi:hypothetical protein
MGHDSGVGFSVRK